MRTLGLVALMTFVWVSTTDALADCDYYAAPGAPLNGAGTLEEPFSVPAFTQAQGGQPMPAQPGTTLCLKDGTYLGPENWLLLEEVHGGAAAGQQITVRALNDGMVTFDGQFDPQGYNWSPVAVRGSSYIDLEGFDVVNSGRNRALTIEAMDTNQVIEEGLEKPIDRPSHHINVRRVVAVNADPGWADVDQDGVLDALDNCLVPERLESSSKNPLTPDENGNLRQRDTDKDGFGNRCDCDFPEAEGEVGDGVCDSDDRSLIISAICEDTPGADFGIPDLSCSTYQFIVTVEEHVRDDLDMDGSGSVDLEDWGIFYDPNVTTPGPAGSTRGEPYTNAMVISISGVHDVLLEDVAAFGTGRKMIQVFRSVNVTLRRTWSRWEGNGGRNNQGVSCAYRAYGTQCQNVLSTANGSQRPIGGPSFGPGRGLIGVDAALQPADHIILPQASVPEPANEFSTALEVGNSLAYVLEAEDCSREQPEWGGESPVGESRAPASGLYFSSGRDTSWTDNVVYCNRDPLDESPMMKDIAFLSVCVNGHFPVPGPSCGAELVTEPGLYADNITSFGTRTQTPYLSVPPLEYPLHFPVREEFWDWEEGILFRQHEQVPSEPEILQSVFIADDENGAIPDQGGQLCYRTNEPGVPLWPWPMRSRIIAATAAELEYPMPDTLRPEGAWQPEVADVHEHVVSMFGRIPAQCLDSDGDLEADDVDNCAYYPNAPDGSGTQLDSNGDGIGDACDVGIFEDFAGASVGDLFPSSSDWVVGEAQNLDTPASGLFAVSEVDGSNVLTTTSRDVNIHAHYTGALVDGDYLYSGRMKLGSGRWNKGLGVTFSSQYGRGASPHDVYYRIRAYADGAFGLAPHPDGGPGDRSANFVGTLMSDFVPTEDQWVRFKIEVTAQADTTRIRAKLWNEGAGSEPVDWQIDAIDQAPPTPADGHVGVWSMSGTMHWDDLQVERISGLTD